MRLETQATFSEHRKLFFTSLHVHRGWFICMAIEKRSDAGGCGLDSISNATRKLHLVPLQKVFNSV